MKIGAAKMSGTENDLFWTAHLLATDKVDLADHANLQQRVQHTPGRMTSQFALPGEAGSFPRPCFYIERAKRFDACWNLQSKNCDAPCVQRSLLPCDDSAASCCPDDASRVPKYTTTCIEQPLRIG